jgi:hypothetical protein
LKLIDVTWRESKTEIRASSPTMEKTVDLVHLRETLKVPVRTLMLKCNLFSDDPALAGAPFEDRTEEIQTVGWSERRTFVGYEFGVFQTSQERKINLCESVSGTLQRDSQNKKRSFHHCTMLTFSYRVLCESRSRAFFDRKKMGEIV